MQRSGSNSSVASSSSGRANTARPASSSHRRHVTFVAHEPRPPQQQQQQQHKKQEGQGTGGETPAPPAKPKPKAFIPRNPDGYYPIVNTKILREHEAKTGKPIDPYGREAAAAAVSAASSSSLGGSPRSPTAASTSFSVGNLYGVPLAALSGRQRAVMHHAQEMHEQRIEAYNSFKHRIQNIQHNLNVADTTLFGDMDSSATAADGGTTTSGGTAQRRFEVDGILSHREAIKEILEATNWCAARRPPGWESSSSSSAEGSSDDDDDGEAGRAKSKTSSSVFSSSTQDAKKAPRRTLLQNVQQKAHDGVDLELVAGAMKSASRQQRKRNIMAARAAGLLDDDDEEDLLRREAGGGGGDADGDGDRSDDSDILSGAEHFVDQNSRFVHDGESLLSQVDVIRNTSSVPPEFLPDNGDGDGTTSTRDDASDVDERATTITSGHQSQQQQQQQQQQSRAGSEDGKRTDITGVSVDEVMQRFTQPVQPALDFFSTSTDRVEKDIKLMDPPLRLEQAQGKFFVVGRQYADVASRMIRAIDSCRGGAEHCLKLLQPSLKLKQSAGMSRMQLLQQQQQQAMQQAAAAAAASSSKKKGKNKSESGGDEIAAVAVGAGFSSPLASPEQHAAEMDRILTEERERLQEFRVLSKQLVGIIGGLNRVDQDARDLLDDLSNRDTQMASERSKMNVAKEECTSVITTREEIKSELWLHRASNRMRQAVRRKAERIREKKEAAAALLAGGAVSAQEEEEKQRREQEQSQENIAWRSRHPIPYGVGGPAMATIGGGRIAGPVTVVCVALDRYAEMWGVAPAAATKTLQMFREAVHASLWYISRVAVDTAKRRAFEEARQEAMKKAKDANEEFTDEDEKKVKPKTLAPIIDIFFKEVQRSTVSGAALLAATSAAAIGAASSSSGGGGGGDKKKPSLTPLEWARRSGHIASSSSGGSSGKASDGKGVDGSPSTTGVVGGELYEEDHDAAIAASVRRKRGEKRAKTLHTPLFFSHEPFPFRCLLGPPAEADEMASRSMERQQHKLVAHGVGGGGRGYGGSMAHLAEDATYMNVGPPPVCLVAEGDGAMPGSGDGGYYMIGFADSSVAAKWACGLQLLLSQLPWTEALLAAEIGSNRVSGGREKIFPQLQRFDPSIRDRMAAAEAQVAAASKGGDGGTSSAATASAAHGFGATSSADTIFGAGGGTSPATTSVSGGGTTAATATATTHQQTAAASASSQQNNITAKAGSTQIEEDAAFIAYSRRFGLQQEESGGPGSAEFDADPWKDLAVLLSRQWGFGDQRFPGALFRGPLVRIGAHTGPVPFDEVRNIQPAKAAPFYWDTVRRCATIPSGDTCARASWLCHAARGGEILVSDEVAAEAQETLKREAIFHRRVPLPATDRDFFANKAAAAAATAKVHMEGPEGDARSLRHGKGRRGSRRGSFSRRSSLGGGAGGGGDGISKTHNTGPGGHPLAAGALASMTDHEEQCAVQLFPPMLLERGLVLGAPSSLTARTSSFIARVTCYNPNWWVWVNTTPQPVVVRQADLAALLPPPSSTSSQVGERTATSSTATGAAAAAAAVSSSAVAAASSRKQQNPEHMATHLPPPVLEMVGWTHAETIQIQRQEIRRCALLVEGSKRLAARALRQQRQAMEVSAALEQKNMFANDMTPFHEAVGILRTAGAESFRGFTVWLGKWQKAFENDIKVPVMQIVPDLGGGTASAAGSPTGAGGGNNLSSSASSLRRSMSIVGSFRYGSFSSRSPKNDFEAANTVTPYVLSNVVLQMVAHRIKIIKEQQHRQNASTVSFEDLFGGAGGSSSKPVEDNSDFARWWLKMESEAPNAASGFVLQLLCRAVDGLYEECFNLVSENVDVASSIYGANAPLAMGKGGGNNNNNAGGGGGGGVDGGPASVGGLATETTATFDAAGNNMSSSQSHSGGILIQRPEHLHQKFCSELLKCIRSLDETFKLPHLLLPSRAVCFFAATRPTNHALNPPNIYDWNTFATDFVSSRWQQHVAELAQVYPWFSPSHVTVSDAISLYNDTARTARWVMPPAVWCRKKLRNTGGGSGGAMALQVVPYGELMDGLREQCIRMWAPFSVRDAGSSFQNLAASVGSGVFSPGASVAAAGSPMSASVSFAVPGIMHHGSSSSASASGVSHVSRSNIGPTASIQDVFGSFLQSSTDQCQILAEHRAALAAALASGIPTMFEFAPYDVAGFDFSTCQNQGTKQNALDAQKKDSCAVRWWNPIRHNSSRMAQFSVVEMRWSAVTSRLILVQLAAAMEFIKRKTQAHHDGNAAAASTGGDAVLGGGAGMNFAASSATGAGLFEFAASAEDHFASSVASVGALNQLRGGSQPVVNLTSSTPGLSWDQLLHPVLGVGIDFDPSRDGGVGRLTIVQPSSPTLHDRLMKDYAAPCFSIFNNATVFSRRKRELLRVAMALAQLHEYGLFHGDLRPDNVFCEEEVGAGDSANARVRFRLANLPLVPQLAVSALCSPRPLLRVIPEEVIDGAKRRMKKSHMAAAMAAASMDSSLSGGSPNASAEFSSSSTHRQEDTASIKSGGGGGAGGGDATRTTAAAAAAATTAKSTDKEEDVSEAVKRLRRYGLPDDDTDDHKWGYIAPELLLHIARGANPNKQLTAQMLAKADMFSFGALLLACMSGGYDHVFTDLESRIDLEEETEAMEREYAAKVAAEEEGREHDPHQHKEQEQHQQSHSGGGGSGNSAAFDHPSASSTAAFDDSSISSPMAASRTIAAGSGGGGKKADGGGAEGEKGPMTAAEKEKMERDKAEILEKRLVFAAAASAYQVVHRASENIDRLVMLGPLKWLRYTIFSSLEKVRSEPTLQDTLVQRRMQMKEDDDILSAKKAGGSGTSAQSFAGVIKKLVARGRKGGTLKIGKKSEEAQRAITGLLLVDLVSKLVVADPSKRLSAAEVCQHPFFADVMVSSATSLPIPSTTCTFDMHPLGPKPEKESSAPTKDASASFSSSPGGPSLQSSLSMMSPPAAAVPASTSTSSPEQPPPQDQQQQQPAVPSVPLTHTSVLASLNPVGGDEDGAATLRGFFKSAELAMLRLRAADNANSGSGGGGGPGTQTMSGLSGIDGGSGSKQSASSGRYFGTSGAESVPIRWTVSLDDALTELPGRKPHHRAPRPGGGGGGVGFVFDSDSTSQSEEENDDDNTTNENKAAAAAAAAAAGLPRRRKKAQMKPLYFDVRISASTRETMSRAWRHQRKTAAALLESNLEAALRRAYDLREFAGIE